MSRVTGPFLRRLDPLLRALTRTLPCPRCAARLSLTLLEPLEDGYGAVVAGGPTVVHNLRTCSHPLDTQQLLAMWADDQLADYAGEPAAESRRSLTR